MAPSNVTRIAGKRALWRVPVFAVLAIGEFFLTSVAFELTGDPDYDIDVISFANGIARFSVVAALTFGLAAWPLRRKLVDRWLQTAATHEFKLCLAINLGLFSALLATRFILSITPSLPSTMAAGYCALLLTTGASLAFVLAPISFWRAIPAIAPVELALAAAGAGFAMFASWLAQESWTVLASATLNVVSWILNLYETGVEVDQARFILGVGEFRVEIAPSCSGYEGVGLVIVFVAIYLWAFRRELAFPNALLLFPIGITLIWLLNAVRIAVLVSIGAHLVPEIAVNGFHSQAGWIIFLAVTVGLIIASHQIPFFRAHDRRRLAVTVGARLSSGRDPTLAFLAPFMALMATSILAHAVAPYDRWLYPVKVIAVVATLWMFRDVYLRLLSRVSMLSVIAGAVIGVIWIATDPAPAGESPLGIWLAALPAWVAAAWLTFRAFGSVILVPIAEELAFRGYLHRALIAKRFESVEPGHFAWVALVVSSAAFGLMHQRWLSAALAGGVYALLMYRTNRLSDPIAAHMASNGVIVLWAIANEQWSLL